MQRVKAQRDEREQTMLVNNVMMLLLLLLHRPASRAGDSWSASRASLNKHLLRIPTRIRCVRLYLYTNSACLFFNLSTYFISIHPARVSSRASSSTSHQHTTHPSIHPSTHPSQRHGHCGLLWNGSCGRKRTTDDATTFPLCRRL